MNEEKLMKIIARLEGEIMDLEEELEAARKNGEFWYEQARKGMKKDDA